MADSRNIDDVALEIYARLAVVMETRKQDDLRFVPREELPSVAYGYAQKFVDEQRARAEPATSAPLRL